MDKFLIKLLHTAQHTHSDQTKNTFAQLRQQVMAGPSGAIKFGSYFIILQIGFGRKSTTKTTTLLKPN